MTHDELRALCRVATPGTWAVPATARLEQIGDDEFFCEWPLRDAAYIAAVSPDVVEGLLDEIARLKALLRFSVTPDAALTGCGGGTCEECDSWRSKVTEALRDS